MTLALGGMIKEEKKTMANKDYNKMSKPAEAKTTNEAVLENAETVATEVAETTETTQEKKTTRKRKAPAHDIHTGSICNCLKLNVRNAPSLDGEVLYTPRAGVKIEVDLTGSTDDFYLVRTPSGAFDGYCMKDYVEIGK